MVSADGSSVILRGAQIQGYNTVSTYRTTTWLNPGAFAAMRSWRMNELRLPFSGCLVTRDPGYLPQLVSRAHEAEHAGLYVVLALFDDLRAGCATDGIKMPLPPVIGEWTAVAAAFRDDADVLFDLYNEPGVGGGQPTVADWTLWRDGGVVRDASGASVTTVGFNDIGRAVREAGAIEQPLVAEAMNTDNLTGVMPYRLSDANTVYSIHSYFEGEDSSPQHWKVMFGQEASSIPVLVGEWAFLPNAQYPVMCADLHLSTAEATTLVQGFLAFMDANGVSYSAWSFTPTQLIIGEQHFAPTSLPNPMVCSQGLTRAGMGAIYKAHLADLSA